MTHYSFIEIGTSDFASLTTQKCYKDKLGISVEPVKKLIDRLPTSDNHIKVNKAIDITSGEKDFYKYIDEYIDLPPNSGKKNDYERGMSSLATADNLKKRITSSVRNDRFEMIKVECITWSQLIQDYDIGSVDYLKIDTEGMDCYLLIELHKTKIRPKMIKFEYCHHSTEVVKEVLDLFTEYEIEKQTKNDIYLIYHIK
tara:strand:- start:273 stop:869 length:597 start_codon:yes stop_codon:yes gene_type:complete